MITALSLKTGDATADCMCWLQVAEAVGLARLELGVQTERWGEVEWAHDIELHDTTARLAAAVMFVHFNSASSSSRSKSDGQHLLGF